MTQKKQPVAELAQKSEAIDMTPVYYIRLTKNLKKGTILRFDVAETQIYKEELTPSPREL